MKFHFNKNECSENNELSSVENERKSFSLLNLCKNFVSLIFHKMNALNLTNFFKNLIKGAHNARYIKIQNFSLDKFDKFYINIYRRTNKNSLCEQKQMILLAFIYNKKLFRKSLENICLLNHLPKSLIYRNIAL